MTQARAHAWIEVYLQGVGWIMIEATPASGGASGSSSMDEPVPGQAEETNQQNIEEQKQQNQDSNEDNNEKPNESSDSSNEKQDEQKSQEDKEKENEEKKEDKKAVRKESEQINKVILGIILIVLLLVIGVIILILRRKHILKERDKQLSQENINKRYIAYYDYLNEIMLYDKEIHNDFKDIALKAAYSNIKITDEELNEIVEYVQQALIIIKEKNSSIKLLIYQYIYVLF